MFENFIDKWLKTIRYESSGDTLKLFYFFFMFNRIDFFRAAKQCEAFDGSIEHFLTHAFKPGEEEPCFRLLLDYKFFFFKRTFKKCSFTHFYAFSSRSISRRHWQIHLSFP